MVMVTDLSPPSAATAFGVWASPPRRGRWRRNADEEIASGDSGSRLRGVILG